VATREPKLDINHNLNILNPGPWDSSPADPIHIDRDLRRGRELHEKHWGAVVPEHLDSHLKRSTLANWCPPSMVRRLSAPCPRRDTANRRETQAAENNSHKDMLGS